MNTLYVVPESWDLTLDVLGNIAVAEAPYALAQDAASAIKTRLGEVYYDTTLGVQYDQILGRPPIISFMKGQFAAAARTVPGVVAAVCFISSITERTVAGQVQVTDQAGVITGANF